MIIVKKLVVELQKKLVLRFVSCSLPQGKITVFIGKSGAGKTILLKSLAGLVNRKDGSIIIDDKEISTLTARQRSEKIGYVFQDFNLFAHLSVYRNCIDPLLVRGIPFAQADLCVKEMLECVEMSLYVNKYPAELSGGQQQRVAIARALCLNPQILLLDEPTAALDPENSSNIALLLRKLARANIAIGVASHDMIFVKEIFDRGYKMKDGIIVESLDSYGQEN